MTFEKHFFVGAGCSCFPDYLYRFIF